MLTAGPGDEAVAAVDRAKVDCMLLDIMMPGMSGFEALRQVWERGDIPVLILSARDGDADKIRGLGLGTDDYIVESATPAEVVARVKAVLRRSGRAAGRRSLHRLPPGFSWVGRRSAAGSRAGSGRIARNRPSVAAFRRGGIARVTWAELHWAGHEFHPFPASQRALKRARHSAPASRRAWVVAGGRGSPRLRLPARGSCGRGHSPVPPASLRPSGRRMG